MDIVIVGAGPTGCFLGIAWSRRGHQVVVVDRAEPPAADGSWPGRGVGQFHQPHFFRPQVTDALNAEMPDVVTALETAGAELRTGTYVRTGEANRTIMLRREKLDPVLWRCLAAEPNVTWVRATAREVASAPGGRIRVQTTAGPLVGDLVVNTSGKVRGFADDLRAPAEIVDGGVSYISRQYQLSPDGREHLPEQLSGQWLFEGYDAIVFEHEPGVISVLFERLSDDRGLAGLRDSSAFDRAVAAIEPLALRVNPQYVRPLGVVRPGGRLMSQYRGQLLPSGEVALPGLLHAGEAACSPSPSRGRGTATSLIQARKLLELVDSDLPRDEMTVAFHKWSHEHLRPWYVDQARDDLVSLHLWRDGDLDLDVAPASRLILEANADDESLHDQLAA